MRMVDEERLESQSGGLGLRRVGQWQGMSILLLDEGALCGILRPEQEKDVGLLDAFQDSFFEEVSGGETFAIIEILIP